MARKNKAPAKSFQQRQTEKRAAQQDQAVVEDMAAAYTCAEHLARDLAGQCEVRLDDLDYDLICSDLALGFWADGPAAAQPVLDLVRELDVEHRRSRDALIALRARLLEAAEQQGAHVHLEAHPIEHYREKIKRRLFPHA